MLLPDPTEMTIDTLSLAIRELMAETLPAEWAEACITVEIETQESGLTYGQYKRNLEDDQWHSFDIDYRLYFAFVALRQQLYVCMGQSWSTARAILFPNGALTFTFDPMP